MKYLILLTVILSGCVPVETPEPAIDYSGHQATVTLKYAPVLYVGDSNCFEENKDYPMAWEIAGIDGDCIQGRKLIDVISLPDSDIIFLALGVNDAHWQVPDSMYVNKLIELLDSTDAMVYCVLPISISPSGFSSTSKRNAMLNNCVNTIDPLEYGVTVVHGDGVHWSAQDNVNYSPAITSRI